MILTNTLGMAFSKQSLSRILRDVEGKRKLHFCLRWPKAQSPRTCSNTKTDAGSFIEMQALVGGISSWLTFARDLRPSLALAVVMYFATVGLAIGQSPREMPFSFSLRDDATTSAGVYTSDGTLIKTLWSGVKYKAGNHTGIWNGIDDGGHLASNGNYQVKVVSNNVRYDWEGVIGNTSQNFTGSTVHHANEVILGMAVTGTTAYYTVGYTEGAVTRLKFDTSDPNVKYNASAGDGQTVRFIATDGTQVYWGGGGHIEDHASSFITASLVGRDTDYMFSEGVFVHTLKGNYKSGIDVTDTELSGMTVQKSGNYLLAAHKTQNVIKTFDKHTGVLVATTAVVNAREIAVDANDNVWVIYDATTVEKFAVNQDGTLSPTGVRLNGLLQPLAVACSPDGATVTVVDGSTNQQVKGFATSNGALSWTLGQVGGYATDPNVANDKFHFGNAKIFDPKALNGGAAVPYIAYQPDGSFWVGDCGNLRSQHFRADRTYVNTIQYLGYFYSCVADINDPTRVFANYLEFKVDYSKPLAPGNGSWEFVRNWSRGVDPALDDQGSRLKSVTTLSNGRTYALALHVANNFAYQIVELPPTGNLRYTGIEPVRNHSDLYSDGSLWTISDSEVGKPAVWKRKPLVGFDTNNNPQWGDDVVVVTSPRVQVDDPVAQDGYIWRNQLTSSGVFASWSPDNPTNPGDRGFGYHLGGINQATGTWQWKTSPSTTKDYLGPFPGDGAFDVGNYVSYGGTFAQAVDRNVFWGYRGEFWKAGQTNKYNHYLDNGLLVGQFGEVRYAGGVPEEAGAGMAGNPVTGTFVKVGDDVYLYHCDENQHGGIHRWKISGLNTIQEQLAATLTLTSTHGLSRQFFTTEDLNNANLVNSSEVDALQLADQENSARWTGFVQSAQSENYTFIAAANRKVRLWVDDVVVIDQWNNTGQAEFASAPIALVAGERHALRMEISGGGASLSWSSPSQAKELIPSANLYAAPLPNTSNGLNLLADLPFNGSVENDLYGWTRNPAQDYGTARSYDTWHVRTNVHTLNKVAPDVQVIFRPNQASTTPGTTEVNRDLGTLTKDLDEWEIKGLIKYPILDSDFPGDMSYFQVLDEKNKVIARFRRKVLDIYSDYRVYGNEALLLQTNSEGINAIGPLAQPLRIQADAEGITFSYAGLPAVTAPVLDPTSNWRRPKTLQLFFYSRNNKEHLIDIAEVRFLKQGVKQVLATTEADKRKVSTLFVYPNPARNFLQVGYPAANAGSLEIIDLYGKRAKLISTKPGSTSSSVDISTLPKGIYVLRFSTGLLIKTTKFIKE